MSTLLAALMLCCFATQSGDAGAVPGAKSTTQSDANTTTRNSSDASASDSSKNDSLFVQPALNGILDFDIDDQGNIGFLRCEKEPFNAITLVTIDAHGKLLSKVRLPESECKNSGIHSVGWSQEAEWFTWTTNDCPRFRLQVLAVDTETRQVRNRFSRIGNADDAFTPDHRGGFVLYSPEFRHVADINYVFERGVLIAYDELDRESWRATGESPGSPRMPLSGALTVMRDGSVVLFDQNDEGLLLFNSNGDFIRRVDSGRMRHCMPFGQGIYPGLEGEILIDGPVAGGLAMRALIGNSQDEDMSHPVVPSTEFRCDTELGRMGYCYQVVSPNLPEEVSRATYSTARSAPNGDLWIQAGDQFFLLDGKCNIKLTIAGRDPRPRSKANP